MGRRIILTMLIPLLVLTMAACDIGNEREEEPEEANEVDQPQPEPLDSDEDEDDNEDAVGREIYTVEARFMGLADANSAEFEIVESGEYDFVQELNVFRFGEEVIEDFNEGVYDVGEVITLYITIEEAEDYNIYTIERAQPGN